MTSISSFQSWFIVIIIIAFINLVWFFLWVFIQWKKYCLRKDYSDLGITNNYLNKGFFERRYKNGQDKE